MRCTNPGECRSDIHASVRSAQDTAVTIMLFQGKVVVQQLDLADLSSVHKLARQLNSEQSIDFLILNAGVMACPQAYTKDHFELQVGTNHFGHFELTRLLLNKMQSQVNTCL